MTDLTEFLLARYAEDEATVRPDIHEPESWCDRAEGVHLESARVLADIAAKRRIVEFYAVAMQEGDEPDVIHAYADVCEALASVYADHPDYRPEWAPGSVSR